MENYFLFSCKNAKGNIASAFTPRGTKLAQDLISDLEGINDLPFDLSLVKLSIDNNGIVESDDLENIKEIWLDYQPNNLFGPLFSEKLKLVIENNLTGKEKLDWISCNVKGNNENKNYFIPRFNKILDVLDLNKTLFVQGTNHIIKPVFSFSKIKDINIFSKPDSYNLWKISSALYVSEKLKNAIQKEKFSGIDFEKTYVTET